MNIGAAPLVVRASALSPSPPYHVTIKALRTYNLSGGLLCLFLKIKLKEYQAS